MRISEIFISCQGEGPQSGVSVNFIRLQGCNVRCSFCDTKYSLDFNGGHELSTDEILTKLSTSNKKVYITGGEPLLYDQQIKELVFNLINQSYQVTIATNGTLLRPSWWKRVIWDVDFKCPSSGIDKFDWSWKTIGKKNNLKFVVGDNDDLNFALEQVNHIKYNNSLCPTIVISPVINTELFYKDIWMQKVWNFCVEHDLRFSLQTHKVVWGLKKGV